MKESREKMKKLVEHIGKTLYVYILYIFIVYPLLYYTVHILLFLCFNLSFSLSFFFTRSFLFLSFSPKCSLSFSSFQHHTAHFHPSTALPTLTALSSTALHRSIQAVSGVRENFFRKQVEGTNVSLRPTLVKTPSYLHTTGAGT